MFDLVVLGELSGLAGKAARFDASSACEDELLDAARLLADTRRALDAATAHVLAELDRQDTTDREVGLATGMWFAREAGMPVSAGRDRVRTARVLSDRLHEVDEALSRAALAATRSDGDRRRASLTRRLRTVHVFAFIFTPSDEAATTVRQP